MLTCYDESICSHRGRSGVKVDNCILLLVLRTLVLERVLFPWLPEAPKRFAPHILFSQVQIGMLNMSGDL